MKSEVLEASEKALERRLQELRAEHQKGLKLIQETQAQVLRIEGAMAVIQELLNKQASPSNGKKAAEV